MSVLWAHNKYIKEAKSVEVNYDIDLNDKDKANAEYIKAYASVLREEYESMRREEEISIRNDWMVKGILESAHRFVKNDVMCLFIGDKKHWSGMKETLQGLGAETHEVSVLGDIKKFMEKHAEIISGS